jgi:hypothetical protein
VTKVFGRDAAVKESSSITVMSYEINKEFSDDIFDITFPAGTEVMDDTMRLFYRLDDEGRTVEIVP